MPWQSVPWQPAFRFRNSAGARPPAADDRANHVGHSPEEVKPARRPRRLAYRDTTADTDVATELAWNPAVNDEAALPRDFDARLQDSSRLAFRVAYSVLRCRQDAEDVAQEAFLRAHRCFNAIRDRERFRAWIVRTTFRLALDQVRGAKRRTRREDVVARDATLEAASTEEGILRDELRAQVADAVAALPEKLRLVVVLVAIEEQDLASVARLLELPIGTVKTRLHRARKELAERLRWIASDTATR